MVGYGWPYGYSSFRDYIHFREGNNQLRISQNPTLPKCQDAVTGNPVKPNLFFNLKTAETSSSTSLGLRRSGQSFEPNVFVNEGWSWFHFPEVCFKALYYISEDYDCKNISDVLGVYCILNCSAITGGYHHMSIAQKSHHNKQKTTATPRNIVTKCETLQPWTPAIYIFA